MNTEEPVCDNGWLADMIRRTPEHLELKSDSELNGYFKTANPYVDIWLFGCAQPRNVNGSRPCLSLMDMDTRSMNRELKDMFEEEEDEELLI